MSLQCDHCGADISEVNLVDSPHVADDRLYCLDCYAYLFPPGWTDEQELDESEMVILALFDFMRVIEYRSQEF